MWPDSVIDLFKVIPPNASVNDLNGPYNKLLLTVFPPNSKFLVAPRHLRNPKNLAEFTTMFEVFLMDELARKPVLILEVNPSNHLMDPSKCKAADDRIRTHMRGMRALCPLKTLHAISVIGTKSCFYSLDTAGDDVEIVPSTLPHHPRTTTADHWGYEIMEPAGEARMRKVVQEVMDGCATLSG